MEENKKLEIKPSILFEVGRLAISFQYSSVDKELNFYAHKRLDERGFFNLKSCNYDIDVLVKSIECFSLLAKEDELILKQLNSYLGVNFLKKDYDLIYKLVGNGVNKDLCTKFVLSKYNMDILK